MLAIDLVDRLIDFAGADGAGDSALRKARRAIQDANRAFPGLHRWTYHYTHGRINLNAAYNTGAVAYNSTTRDLTLTGGTWPSWAASGKVRIGDVIAYVSSRTSNSVVVVESATAFAADIDAGSSYDLYQDEYALPDDFLATDAPLSEGIFCSLDYLHPQSVEWLERSAYRTGRPQFYTIWPMRSTASTLGRYSIRVTPVPDTSETMDILYQRKMRAILYDQENVGTVTVANASASLTGAGVTFRDDMVGATIRISYNNSPPTDVEGGNRYGFQTLIESVQSATALTLAEAATAAFTGMGYTISDRLDIEDGAMATAFSWQAINRMAQELRMKDRAAIEADATKQLWLAKEQDSRVFASKVAGGASRLRSRWRGPTGTDEV